MKHAGAAAQFYRTRFPAFDALRLLAIFGVIALHVRFEPSLALEPGAILRLSMRWCVPFFFMLTGFFLPALDGFPNIDIDRVRRITIVAFVANLLFLPLSVAMYGVAIVDADRLMTGTWFHLWFLNSMVLGFVCFLVFPRLVRRSWLMTAIASLLVCGFYAFDVLSSIRPLAFDEAVAAVRGLQSISFMWIGFLLGQNRARLPGARLALVMMVAGGILVAIEALESVHLGYSVMERQFPAGALIVAIGLVIWCARTDFDALPAFLPRFGRDYALTIYIVHPIFLKVGASLLGLLPLALDPRLFLTIVFGFFASLVAAIALDRAWPLAAAVLRGQLPEPKHFQRLPAAGA